MDHDILPPEMLPDWVPPLIQEHYRRIYEGDDGKNSGGYIGHVFGLIALYGRPKSELAPLMSALCFEREMERFWGSISSSYVEKVGNLEPLFRKILQYGVCPCKWWRWLYRFTCMSSIITRWLHASHTR